MEHQECCEKCTCSHVGATTQHFRTRCDKILCKCHKISSTESKEECDCPTKYCRHYESDFDRFVKTVYEAVKPDIKPEIEHYSQPLCPEFNLAAYEAGRNQGRRDRQLGDVDDWDAETWEAYERGKKAGIEESLDRVHNQLSWSEDTKSYKEMALRVISNLLK